jgi:hypothetical protein
MQSWRSRGAMLCHQQTEAQGTGGVTWAEPDVDDHGSHWGESQSEDKPESWAGVRASRGSPRPTARSSTIQAQELPVVLMLQERKSLALLCLFAPLNLN